MQVSFPITAIGGGGNKITLGPSTTISSAYRYAACAARLTDTTGIVFVHDSATAVYAFYFSVGTGAITLGSGVKVNVGSENIEPIGFSASRVAGDKVIVSYNVDYATGGNKNYVAVVTNSGGVLTVGSRVELSRGGGYTALLTLSATQVAAVGESSAHILDIVGSGITAGAAQPIGDMGSACLYSASYLCGVRNASPSALAELATITASSIATASTAAVNTKISDSDTHYISPLDSTRCLVVWKTTSDTYPKSSVITRSASTITRGTVYSNVLSNSINNIFSTQITGNNTLVAGVSGSSTVYCRVIQANGSIVNNSFGPQTTISGSFNNGVVSLTTLSPSLVMMAYGGSVSSGLRALRVS